MNYRTLENGSGAVGVKMEAWNGQKAALSIRWRFWPPNSELRSSISELGGADSELGGTNSGLGASNASWSSSVSNSETANRSLSGALLIGEGSWFPPRASSYHPETCLLLLPCPTCLLPTLRRPFRWRSFRIRCACWRRSPTRCAMRRCVRWRRGCI